MFEDCVAKARPELRAVALDVAGEAAKGFAAIHHLLRQLREAGSLEEGMAGQSMAKNEGLPVDVGPLRFVPAIEQLP